MSNFIKALEDEASNLEPELARDPRYIKLQEVKRLRALYAAQHGEDNEGLVAAQPRLTQIKQTQRPIASGISLDAVSATRDLLSSRTTPMLTREILTHLEAIDITFGGGVCQTSCPPISCGVSDFRGAGVAFRVQPDRSGGLPVAGFA